MNTNFSSTLLSITKLFILFVISGAAYFANAQAATLILTINGGSSAAIINGDDITLSWYIDGTVSNCSINNGVGVINVSSLPATGSLVVTPPANASTNYVLNCDGQTDAVVLDIIPVVNITLPGGTNRTADGDGRVIDTYVNWTSTFANRCSDVWYEEDSNPGVKIFAHNTSWTSGWLQPIGSNRYYSDWYTGRYITQSSTFYIECYNDTNHTSAIGQVHMTVTNPPPLPDPYINLWAQYSSITRNATYGYAWDYIHFDAHGVNNCYYKTYYDNMTEYPWPQGFGAGSSYTSYNFYSVKLSTTTVFEVKCTRNAQTYAGTFYPATSTTERVRVEVITPVNFVYDRMTLPPVTITATANPNPTIKNAISGTAYTLVTVQPKNADFCLARAYRMDGTEYWIYGWTRTDIGYPQPGNSNWSVGVTLATTTRLNIYCARQYDLSFGTPAEIANGSETFDLTVVVEEPLVALSVPKVYLYGNSYSPSVSTMSGSATQRIGWVVPAWYFKGNSGGFVNKITFPFKHPFGASDIYNIHLGYYDENDGVSTFTFSTAADGLIGTIVSDRADAVGSSPSESSNRHIDLAAAGVNLTDGELITIECTATGGENCAFDRVYFGAGDGANILAPVSTTTGFPVVPMMWISERAETCAGLPAVRADGSTYSWVGSGQPTYKTTDVLVSTTTTFGIRCSRTFDGAFDESTVRIVLPGTGTGSTTLTTETVVSSGECIDPLSLVSIEAPTGYRANPTTGLCEPAVDLAAVSPAVSLASAVENNIDGTYDNVDTLIVIENLGPGDLPADSAITYSANMTFLPIYSLPVLSTLVGTYNGSLLAPVAPATSVQSSTLTSQFDGVPFGTHTVCSKVNLDGAPNYPESSVDFTNNTSCRSVTLPVPRPPMVLTADRKIIRSGQSVTLNWSVNVTYQLFCTVTGPGLSDSFNTLAFPNPYTDSFATSAITSSSKYELSCNEPITNTTFIEDLTVEVVPESQEI